MIIGISGKKGSGKDTVAKILQYFTLPEELRTISIDEWVYELSYHQEVSDKLSTYLETHKFGNKLKDCVSILLNVPRWKLELEEYKQQVLPESWDRWILVTEMGPSVHTTKSEALMIINYFGLAPGEYQLEKQSLTIRDMLQQIGTDALRYAVHPNIWINGLFSDYVPDGALNLTKLKSGKSKTIIKNPVWPSWVVPDVRFLNEVDAIKNGLPGYSVDSNDFRYIIRVERPDRYLDEDMHISEIQLDDYDKWDYILDNSKTLDDLAFEIHVMLSSNPIFKNYFHV